jgi:hypothetical protein
MTAAAAPYRTLSLLLFVLSAVEGISGLFLIFASRFVLAMAPANLALPGPEVIVLFLKAIGIVALALGYLLCVAARDPARYVAVVDVVAFMCVAAAILEVYALAELNLGALYPPSYVIARAVLQLILAVILIWLRPTRTPARSPQ